MSKNSLPQTKKVLWSDCAPYFKKGWNLKEMVYDKPRSRKEAPIVWAVIEKN